MFLPCKALDQRELVVWLGLWQYGIKGFLRNVKIALGEPWPEWVKVSFKIVTQLMKISLYWVLHLHSSLIILRKNQVKKKNYNKYIFIYLYTFKSWNLVFIVAMLLLNQINSYIIHPFSTFFCQFFFFHINFTTYCYTFSNFFPPFYLFIFLLLSTLISLFLYPFIFHYFWLYLIPLLLL